MPARRWTGPPSSSNGPCHTCIWRARCLAAPASRIKPSTPCRSRPNRSPPHSTWCWSSSRLNSGATQSSRCFARRIFNGRGQVSAHSTETCPRPAVPSRRSIARSATHGISANSIGCASSLRIGPARPTPCPHSTRRLPRRTRYSRCWIARRRRCSSRGSRRFWLRAWRPRRSGSAARRRRCSAFLNRWRQLTPSTTTARRRSTRSRPICAAGSKTKRSCPTTPERVCNCSTRRLPGTANSMTWSSSA